MGSGTAIRLAVLEGLYAINGLTVERSRLVTTSARGGTSGIGVNTYFSGGFVLDLGVPNDQLGFAPSSQARPVSQPTALPFLPMPDWQLCLCLPRSIIPKTQEEERDFFDRTTPLSPQQSHRAAYNALFHIYGSIAEQNYEMFCTGVNTMQETAWKKAEWMEYGSSLNQLRSSLQDLGADCVGLSSLGPMVFCFANSEVLADIERRQKEMDCDVILSVPCNVGRSVDPEPQCAI